MKNWLLEYLRCPACKTDLVLHAFNGKSDRISAGVLVCRDPSCKSWYPIIRGIPRLLNAELRKLLTEEFVASYRAQLMDIGLLIFQDQNAQDNLHQLKLHTIQNFGFEWTEYDRFGWDDPVYNKSHEEKIFLRKSLLKPNEISGKLMLDAGCGNGRYCYWASSLGGRVIGIDLGDAVESAHKNTLDLPNIGIVQADIFKLPFPDNYFDIIYSIGVLMHTGNTKKATASLASKLKENGSLTVHVYGKGNFIYEFFDKTIRDRTTKMSISELQDFTKKLYKTRQFLEKIKLENLVNLFVKIDPHPHCIFDWYAAPIALHHTYPEVIGWFQEMGFEIIKTNRNSIYLGPKTETMNKFKLVLLRLAKRIIYPLENIPVTVKGHKQG